MADPELVSYLQKSVAFGQVDELYIDLQLDAQGLADKFNKSSNKAKNSSSVEADFTFNNITKPYPGLRPFKTSESFLFFGREKLEKDILKKLQTSRFLAVIGASGTGKSSLIRAGLIPNLHWGYLPGDTMNWKVCICRPGMNPLDNLAVAITCTDHFYYEEELQKSKEHFSKNKRQIRTNPFALSEIASRSKEKNNSLIIIDQFEELFKFYNENQESQIKEEAELFIDQLLNVTAPEFDNTIYVIITMRSEFLGDTVQFSGLSENINQSQYLVPKLSRKQLIAAIETPAKVFGKRVSPILAKKLSEEIVDNQDQLPVLQHALMRTYQNKFGSETEKEDLEITLEDYRKIGELKLALSEHADSIYNSLNKEEKKIAKLLFQTITDLNDTRRPVTFGELVRIFSAYRNSEKLLKFVIDKFRADDCSFVFPPPTMEIRANTIIDISHESLMRLWGKLKKWIEDEEENGNTYKSIQNHRLFNEKIKKNEPLTGGRLKMAEYWWDKYQPNQYWASRYHDFEERETLIKKSIKNNGFSSVELKEITNNVDKEIFELNLLLLEKSKKKDRQKDQLKVWIIVGVIIALSIISIFLFFENEETKKAKIKAMDSQTIATTEKTTADSLRKIAVSNAVLLEKHIMEIDKEKRKAVIAYSQAYSAAIDAMESKREADLRTIEAERERENAKAKELETLRMTLQLNENSIQEYLQQSKFHFENLNSKLGLFALFHALQIELSDDPVIIDKIETVKHERDSMITNMIHEAISSELIQEGQDLGLIDKVRLLDNNHLILLYKSGEILNIDFSENNRKTITWSTSVMVNRLRDLIDEPDDKVKIITEVDLQLFNAKPLTIDFFVTLSYHLANKSVISNKQLRNNNVLTTDNRPQTDKIVGWYRLTNMKDVDSVAVKNAYSEIKLGNDKVFIYDMISGIFLKNKIVWFESDYTTKKILGIFNKFSRKDYLRTFNIDSETLQSIQISSEFYYNKYWSSALLTMDSLIIYTDETYSLVADDSIKYLNCTNSSSNFSKYINLDSKKYNFESFGDKKIAFDNDCFINNVPHLKRTSDNDILILNGEKYELPSKISRKTSLNDYLFADFLDDSNIILVTKNRYYIWYVGERIRGQYKVDELINELGSTYWHLTDNEKKANKLESDFSKNLQISIK